MNKYYSSSDYSSYSYSSQCFDPHSQREEMPSSKVGKISYRRSSYPLQLGDGGEVEGELHLHKGPPRGREVEVLMEERWGS